MFSSYYMSLTGHVSPNQMSETDVPVVVISPEDREQVERLSSLIEANGGPRFGRRSVDSLADALREFANPTPPKPEEPTGLGAVVATESDGDWIRVSVELANPWLNVQTGSQRHWDGVTAVRILSEGVTA